MCPALPQRHQRLQWGAGRLVWARAPSSTAGTGAEGQSAAARQYLGKFHLGNCTFGKLPLGEKSLGKYLISV